MKQGKRNWFNIVTTAWPFALVLVATTWFVAPAFAGGGGPDCGGVCADFCGMLGSDCDSYSYSSAHCDVFCDDGSSKEIYCPSV